MNGEVIFAFAIVFVLFSIFSVIAASMSDDTPTRITKWIVLGISFVLLAIALSAAIGIAFFLWSIIL